MLFEFDVVGGKEEVEAQANEPSTYMVLCARTSCAKNVKEMCEPRSLLRECVKGGKLRRCNNSNTVRERE